MPRKAVGGSPAPVSCSAGGAKKAPAKKSKSKAMKGGFELAGPTAAGLLLLAEEVARRYTKAGRKARVSRKVRGGGSEEYTPTDEVIDGQAVWADDAGAKYIQVEKDGDLVFEPVVVSHSIAIDNDDDLDAGEEESVPLEDVNQINTGATATTATATAFVILPDDTIKKCVSKNGAYAEDDCEQAITKAEIDKNIAVLQAMRERVDAVIQAGGGKKKRMSKKRATKKRVMRKRGGGDGDADGGAPFAKYLGIDSIASRMGGKMGDITQGLNDIIAGAGAAPPALVEQPVVEQPVVEQPAVELEGGGRKKKAAAKKPAKKQSGGDSCYAHFGPDHSQFGAPVAAKDAATFTATGGGKGKNKGKGKKQSGGDFAAIAGALYK